ncbi:hypothetical protein RFI_09197 [Reticulomyxa filosa]|uniref:Uncharacterized protein n=1 Tax=Reticulomyxa filosa TaxID=46433 RepID=X6NRI4_RETFI|nr:hypothetical protein RFI_09197 [Reticulomyxa filosa]|eukprot:ETO27932.1 hypothetical protein RFI_09197 [Reticulomyxa filosa]
MDSATIWFGRCFIQKKDLDYCKLQSQKNDRRHCVVCGGPPTELDVPNVSKEWLTSLSLSSANINGSGTGMTYKCSQCFSRCHLSCLKKECVERKQKKRDDSKSERESENEHEEMVITCPMCEKGSSIDEKVTNKHLFLIGRGEKKDYSRLQESMIEEKKLLRDWATNECVACGERGSSLRCALCFCDEGANAQAMKMAMDVQKRRNYTRLQSKQLEEMKSELERQYEWDKAIGSRLFITGDRQLDCVGQFHLRCIVGKEAEDNERESGEQETETEEKEEEEEEEKKKKKKKKMMIIMTIIIMTIMIMTIMKMKKKKKKKKKKKNKKKKKRKKISKNAPNQTRETRS